MEGKRDEQSLHDDIDTAVGAAAAKAHASVDRAADKIDAAAEKIRLIWVGLA